MCPKLKNRKIYASEKDAQLIDNKTLPRRHDEVGSNHSLIVTIYCLIFVLLISLIKSTKKIMRIENIFWQSEIVIS